MEEVGYRFREASIEDVAPLRGLAGSSLSHPDGKGRRESYRPAASRGELLLLERYESRTRQWRICAFADWHMRVDDVLTIRDMATEGDLPSSSMVKQLVMELIRSLAPVEIVLKTRTDVPDWNEIVRSIPGFDLEGSEYRRPHWINIWRWSRELAARTTRAPSAPRFRR